MTHMPPNKGEISHQTALAGKREVRISFLIVIQSPLWARCCLNLALAETMDAHYSSENDREV